MRGDNHNAGGRAFGSALVLAGLLTVAVVWSSTGAIATAPHQGLQQDLISRAVDDAAPSLALGTDEFPLEQHAQNPRHLWRLDMDKLGPEHAMVINEVMPNPTDSGFAWVELYNAGDASVDISHWYVGNSGVGPFQFQVPSGTVIPAHGYATFGQADLGFDLDGRRGDELWITQAWYWARFREPAAAASA